MKKFLNVWKHVNPKSENGTQQKKTCKIKKGETRVKDFCLICKQVCGSEYIFDGVSENSDDVICSKKAHLVCYSGLTNLRLPG